MTKTIFTDASYYNRERDGDLKTYLERHDGINCSNLFHGYGHFKMLWNAGYLEPNVSYIRVMWNVGRGDEHFIVLGERELRGVQAPAHSGREGVHDPKKFLSARGCPPWEAQNLNPNPISRKQTKDITDKL